jgi:hypothetical protein
MKSAFQKVYILGSNRDDALPLYINYEQEDINWMELEEFINGTKPFEDYKPVNFIIKKPKKLVCDYYSGCKQGMVSKRFLEQTNMFDNYRKFPVQINDEDFFVLIIDKVADCFDQANSVWVKYDDADVMMGSIAEYTFFNDKVDVNHVFSIPEYHYIYCTDIVKNDIGKLSNLGFSFIEVYDVTKGRVPIN